MTFGMVLTPLVDTSGANRSRNNLAHHGKF